jgi:hypothetical protein
VAGLPTEILRDAEAEFGRFDKGIKSPNVIFLLLAETPKIAPAVEGLGCTG